MSESRDQVEQLAEEFVRRYRAGECPDVSEYAARHPENAEQIRELFPALVLMEELAPSSSDGSTEPVPLPAPPEERIGDYRLVRQIGAGGMGVVYEALQESLGRRVALKVLTLRPGQDGTALARFRREARAAAQLHHTNIVPVYDVGQAGDVCFYAMQLILGQGLDQVLRDLQHLRSAPVASVAHSLWTGQFEAPAPATDATGPLRATLAPTAPVASASSELSDAGSDPRHYFRRVARIGRQAADALHFAHQRGIIHRDVKPSNLLLDTAGSVWVTDFGLAKTEDEALTQTGDLLGTLRYMSPERFRGTCDVRADVYGLGLTLYELLTLRPAFESTDRLRLMEQIAQLEPARPRHIDRRVPRDLETIVLKAIDKDPARRYPSGADLAEDLRRFLDDEPIRARQVSSSERLVRWARRKPAVASLLGALAGVFLTAFVVVSLLLWRASTLYALAEEKRREAESNLAEANRQKTHAEENFDQARQAVEDYLTQVSESKLLDVPGLHPLRRDLLLSALKFYQTFLQKRQDEPGLQEALAAAYLRVGKIHSALSEHTAAREALGQALERYQSLLRQNGNRAELRAGLAESLMHLGRLGEARQEWNRLLAGDPDNETYQVLLAETLNSLAVSLDRRRQRAEMLRLHREALALREKLFRRRPGDPATASSVGATLNNLAVLTSGGEALDLFRLARKYQEAAHRLAPAVPQYGQFLVVSMRNQANMEWQGDRTRGLATMEQAAAVVDRLAENHPSLTRIRDMQVETHISLLGFCREQKLDRQAKQTQERIARLLDRPAGANRPEHLFRLARLRGLFAIAIGGTGSRAGNADRAEIARQEEQALDCLRRAVAAGFQNPAVLRTDAAFTPLRSRAEFQKICRHVEMLARSRASAVGQISAAALKDQQEALGWLKQFSNPDDPLFQARQASSLYTIGLIQTGLNQLDEARTSLEAALKLRRRLAEAAPKDAAALAAVAHTCLARSRLEWKAGRLARVPSWWQQALRTVDDRPGAPAELTRVRASIQYDVGRAYEALGLWDEGDALVTQALRDGWWRTWEWVGQGLVQCIRGDEQGYRQLCRDAAGRFQAANDSDNRFNLALLGILGPNDAFKTDDVLNWLQRRHEADPQSWRVTFLALGRLRAGQVDQARALVDEARAKMPGYFVNLPLEALLHHHEGKPAEARRWLAKARRWHVRYLQDRLRGEAPEVHDSARHEYKEFLALDREARRLILGRDAVEDPWLALLRARAHTLLGQKDKALAAVNAMIRLAPRDAEPWATWGNVLAGLGRHDEAEKAFARAVTGDPSDSAAWLARGRYRLLRGDRKRADADLLAAAKAGARFQAFLDAGWWVGGPFPADLGQALPVELAPAGPPATWKQILPDTAGTVAFRSFLPKKEPVSVCALAYLPATQERTVTFAGGGKGRQRFWLNGRLVLDRTTQHPWSHIAEPLRLTLRPGVNILLIRAVVEPGFEWFHLRAEDHFLERGHTFGLVGLWPEAARAFAERDMDFLRNGWFRTGQALALLGAGDRPGYRKAAQLMSEQFANETHQGVVLEVLFALLASKEPVVDRERLDRLLGHADTNNFMYSSLSRLHKYRTGDYKGCLAQGANGEVQGLLAALSAAQLGKNDEARRWLARAEEWYDRTTQDRLRAAPLKIPYWWELVLIQQLHAEARAQLAGGKDTWHRAALRGRGLAELGRHREALAEYDKALALHKDQPWVLEARARSQAAQGAAARP